MFVNNTSRTSVYVTRTPITCLSVKVKPLLVLTVTQLTLHQALSCSSNNVSASHHITAEDAVEGVLIEAEK